MWSSYGLRALSAMALGLLAACGAEPRIDPDDVPPTRELQRPAHRAANMEQALMFFRDVCVNTAPSFALAPAVLATMPVTQNKRSGTYFHRRVDMSAKLTPAGCSIVAGGPFTERDITLFEAISPRVTANEPIRFDGRPYISAVYTPGPVAAAEQGLGQ